LLIELDIKVPLVDQIKCIAKVANKANLSEKTKRQAISIMNEVRRKDDEILYSAGKKMNTNNNSNKQFLLNQIVWVGISLGTSLAISILVPFPISLLAIIGIFFLFNLFYIRRRMVKRMGMGMRGGISGSPSSSSSSSTFRDTSLKYYCMSCGTQHKQASCTKCGSKMKRVGS
jgi:hypothetical protein